MDHIAYQSFNPLQNVKGFILTRPPVLVFLICLITFAVTALSLAYFVRTSELRDPNVELDWNILLEKFANLNFCLERNKTHEKPSTAFELILKKEKNEHEMSLTTISDELSANNSISVAISLKFGSEVKNINSNVTTVNGVVPGPFLGFKGVFANNEYHVSFDLPHCETEECKTSFKTVCITFYGLPQLPNTDKMKKCSAHELLLTNSTSFSVQKYPESKEPIWICRGNIFRVVYTSNPNWTVVISEHDKTLINFHLMYTSYFLLLMVMTLLCFAVIRGRPKNKTFVQEKISFDS
uniref:TMEM248/TMEM219 domain-containing protein n=1 Tax=Strigamia maritima TaxID=126957 RepID=T1IQ77_STRMM